jgi:hypothetical protein
MSDLGIDGAPVSVAIDLTSTAGKIGVDDTIASAEHEQEFQAPRYETLNEPVSETIVSIRRLLELAFGGFVAVECATFEGFSPRSYSFCISVLFPSFFSFFPCSTYFQYCAIPYLKNSNLLTQISPAPGSKAHRRQAQTRPDSQQHCQRAP